MLYEFNSFWKNLIIILGSWVAYGVLGYEFCVITLLTLVLIRENKEK
jgi:hypothetical protein